MCCRFTTSALACCNPTAGLNLYKFKQADSLHSLGLGGGGVLTHMPLVALQAPFVHVADRTPAIVYPLSQVPRQTAPSDAGQVCERHAARQWQGVAQRSGQQMSRVAVRFLTGSCQGWPSVGWVCLLEQQVASAVARQSVLVHAMTEDSYMWVLPPSQMNSGFCVILQQQVAKHYSLQGRSA